MLWLAGLMGIMAVGTVAFVDPMGRDDQDDDDASARADIDEMARTLSSGDLFEQSDPRGGDDDADLPPLVADPAQAVSIVEGSEDGDDLTGDAGNQRIFADAGNDTVRAGGGADELRGGSGDDDLDGGSGDDLLHGEDGGDALRGGSQNDALFGHSGADTLHGDDGTDALQGSAGGDLLFGDAGDDVLQGGLDNDTLHGGTGADTLFGGWGDDIIDGRAIGADGADGDGADYLNGGGGDDTIFAGAGDIVTAGTGNDDIVLGPWARAAAAVDILDYIPGEDSVVLIWDDSDDTSEEPTVNLTGDPENAGRTLVLLDGAVVASVVGTDLSAADIALIPQSTAEGLTLPPAG
ncbi:calcium-binding protein [Sulfitobacter albidus]|uniref:Calcium-binding protein n=1 Tax=Sulfitobacter albidus TaxID=2829501 RepID=A0A975PMA2_9RHOB|nr:calcium-binding protein [Sulfitobacter albidus]QUJ76504.1 calcium-binding protein [Sulfitobacter albidus]